MYSFDSKIHAHTVDGKPLLGTSTVVGVIAKPLTWWASGMACSVFGWLDPKKNGPESVYKRAGEVLEQIKQLDTTSYLSLLKKAYGAHNEKKETSAVEGTDMHSLLEAYVKECVERNEGRPLAIGEVSEKVSSFRAWALQNVEKFEFSEVNVYSKEMWTGGITDLIFVMKDGKRLIGDFKSSKEAYISQFVQIAGYDLQQEENGLFTEKGENISPPLKVDGYVVFPFGAKEFEPVFRYNTGELKEGFKSALVLHKLVNQ